MLIIIHSSRDSGGVLNAVYFFVCSLPNCKGIFQAYGMTETSLAATKDIDEDEDERLHKPGSGGFPLRGVKVKVT